MPLLWSLKEWKRIQILMLRAGWFMVIIYGLAHHGVLISLFVWTSPIGNFCTHYFMKRHTIKTCRLKVMFFDLKFLFNLINYSAFHCKWLIVTLVLIHSSILFRHLLVKKKEYLSSLGWLSYSVSNLFFMVQGVRLSKGWCIFPDACVL